MLSSLLATNKSINWS